MDPFTSTKKYGKSNCRDFPIRSHSSAIFKDTVNSEIFSQSLPDALANFRSVSSIGTLLHLQKNSAKVTVGVSQYDLTHQQISHFSSNHSFYEKPRQLLLIIFVLPYLYGPFHVYKKIRQK